MMIFLRLILITSVFALTACNEPEPPREPVKAKVEKKKLMSKNTELRASETEIVTVSIPTAICKMCEKNIAEALALNEGVLETEIFLKKKIVKVVFDPAVTGVDELRKDISDAGYDADNVKRNINAYQKLDECCKIESNIHS